MNDLARKRLPVWALLVATAALCGCATTDGYRDPSDPLEGFNRVVYSFNDGVDKVLLKPVAKGYNAVMPGPVNRGITNFFGNLEDVGSAANNLLQLKLGRAASDVGRVAVNTTVGVLGFMDVASNLDLPKYGEDFGQTLGTWGFGPGPYLVLPLLGPSSVRDTVGRVGDHFLDPITYIEDEKIRWSLRAVKLIDTRADLLATSRVLEQAALDPYAFVRDAYLQKRNSQVHDGNPPLEPLVDP